MGKPRPDLSTASGQAAGPDPAAILDLAVIGGGINGAGIARDAAGRGLSVALIEAGDLGGATSSASTKLIHGGLRYLEFHAYGLVAKALKERERILAIAPHISWPMPFLLPLMPDGRPRWMIRAGLFLYDHLARRREVPGSSFVDLRRDAAGPALRRDLPSAYRYYDGWVDDARLVILNARDAADRGALVLPRDALVRAEPSEAGWQLTLASGRLLSARRLVNAAGPWAGRVAQDVLGVADAPRLSLVQGAHLIVRRVNRTEDAFLLQQPDGRIVFLIPYEGGYSLIGTTETLVDRPDHPTITPAEEAYLLEAVNRFLYRPIGPDAVVHRFAGVRPLVLEEGKGARETTRDWKLVLHAAPGRPAPSEPTALTVVGGKLTTYRLLAEAVLARLFPDTRPWTAGAPLPGGGLPRLPRETSAAAFARFVVETQARFPLHDPALVARLARTWGTEATLMLEDGLGENFGGLFEAEVAHMRGREWAVTSQDILWRRTRMGLHLSAEAKARLAAYLGEVPEPAGLLSVQPMPAARHAPVEPGPAVSS